MYLRLVIILLALAVTTAFGSPESATILKPVRASNRGVDLVPRVETSAIKLGYGIENDSSLVDVVLHVDHPTVLLEDIDALTSLQTTDDTLAMTFSSLEAFEHSAYTWSQHDAILLVANQQGADSDQDERTFFLAHSISRDDSTMSVIASGERSNISSIASSLEVFFFQPSGSSDHSDRVWHPKPYKVSGDSAIPENTVLFSSGDDFSARAREARVNVSASIAGYVHFRIRHCEIKEAYFDVEAGFGASLGLDFNFTVPFGHTITYPIPGLDWSLLHIPGILKLGPMARFEVGIDIGADMPVQVETDVTFAVSHGHLHLDLKDGEKTRIKGWDSVYSSSANVTKRIATVHASPLVQLTMDLGLELLRKVNISGGVTAGPKFVNELGIPAQKHDGKHQQGALDENAPCVNGTELRSKFQFNIDAFITKLWQKTLYSVEKPIWAKCLPL